MSATPALALNSNVLVLNQHFLALAVINAKRAFCMLVCDHAEVVEERDGQFYNHDFSSWQELSGLRQKLPEDQDQFVSTVNQQLLIPRIIRLPRYNRMPRNIIKLNRRNIFARDHHRCQYCNRRVSTSELSIDHILPRARGGLTTWENLVCACVSCNIKKGGRTPEEARMYLKQKPVQPKTSPLIMNSLKDKRYLSWKAFLDEAYWSVELEE